VELHGVGDVVRLLRSADHTVVRGAVDLLKELARDPQICAQVGPLGALELLMDIQHAASGGGEMGMMRAVSRVLELLQVMHALSKVVYDLRKRYEFDLHLRLTMFLHVMTPNRALWMCRRRRPTRPASRGNGFKCVYSSCRYTLDYAPTGTVYAYCAYRALIPVAATAGGHRVGSVDRWSCQGCGSHGQT
jgi:hypothetical protein